MLKNVLFGFLLITCLSVKPCTCLPRKAAILPRDVSIVLTGCKQLIIECQTCKTLDREKKYELLQRVEGAENELWRISPKITVQVKPELVELFNTLNKHEDKLRKKVFAIHHA